MCKKKLTVLLQAAAMISGAVEVAGAPGPETAAGRGGGRRWGAGAGGDAV